MSEAERTDPGLPDRDYREYDDVTPDTVEIELDLASIGDTVWFDVDGDGVIETGEPRLANIDVVVTYLGIDGAPGGGDDETFTVVTDVSGVYLVEDLPGGNYTVDVQRPTPTSSAGSPRATTSTVSPLHPTASGPDRSARTRPSVTSTSGTRAPARSVTRSGSTATATA